jgi:hypothetical protein
MGRPKKTTAKKKVKKTAKVEQPKDPRIEKVYEKEITFMCPVRGLVTQKVKVKRYKPLSQQVAKPIITPSSELEATIEEPGGGLSIYSGEDIGVTDIPEEEH